MSHVIDNLSQTSESGLMYVTKLNQMSHLSELLNCTRSILNWLISSEYQNVKFTLITARDVNSRMPICTHVYHTHLIYGVHFILFFMLT